MPTPRKEAMLADIKERMERASIAVSADYRGLTVAQLTELRRALRPSGAEVKVVKNTLAGMAARAAGRDNMAEILQGPTALAIGYDDPIAPVKALTEHLRARRLNIEIHGGWLEGKVLSRAEVESLIARDADLTARLKELRKEFEDTFKKNVEMVASSRR